MRRILIISALLFGCGGGGKGLVMGDGSVSEGADGAPGQAGEASRATRARTPGEEGAAGSGAADAAALAGDAGADGAADASAADAREVRCDAGWLVVQDWVAPEGVQDPRKCDVEMPDRTTWVNDGNKQKPCHDLLTVEGWYCQECRDVQGRPPPCRVMMNEGHRDMPTMRPWVCVASCSECVPRCQ